MKSLKDKIVAITGAGSGIGRALALAAARQGAQVALSDISQSGLDETAASLPRGSRYSARVLDVADRDAVFAWAAYVAEQHGGVDVIINNAGVSLSDRVGHMKLEDFQWLFNINFWGVIHGVDAFLPYLRQRSDAHIVNISSVFGIVGIPSQSAYNASKFAVRGYTEALRQELEGTPIHVSCVHPGGIKTNIVRGGRHYQDASGSEVDHDTMSRQFDKIAMTTPDQAAQVILRGVLRNDPRILIGGDAKVLDVLARLLPSYYDKVSGTFMRLGQKFAN